MATTHTMVSLLPPEGASSICLQGQNYEIGEDGRVSVPEPEVHQLVQHHGFRVAPPDLLSEKELSERHRRQTHLSKRLEELEGSVARAEEDYTAAQADLETMKDGLAEGMSTVHQVAEASSKVQRLQTLIDTLRSALRKVELELQELTATIQEAERRRETARQNEAAAEFLEEAERIVEAFVDSVRAPREHLERLAELARRQRQELPLADSLPVFKVTDLARRVEASWARKNPLIHGENVLSYVVYILFGPGRTAKDTWPERFNVHAQ